MGGFGQSRSLPLITAVLLALAIGLICLYTLDAVTVDDEFGESESISYSDAEFFMDLSGNGWLRNLTWIGIAVAAVSTLAFSRAQRTLQAVLITLGSLAAMGGPIWILSNLDGDKAGPGVIAAMVCFGIAALAPWVFMLIGRQSASPQYQS